VKACDNKTNVMQDAELEVAVLDTLTDTVLTACPFTPPVMCSRYVQILDRRGNMC